jgi:hypothetical protein
VAFHRINSFQYLQKKTMMIPERAKKKQSKTFQTDLEAKGQSHNQIRTIIVEEASAWDQAEIPCSVIHKAVL